MENFYVLYGLNKGLIKIELEKLLKKFKNSFGTGAINL